MYAIRSYYDHLDVLDVLVGDLGDGDVEDVQVLPPDRLTSGRIINAKIAHERP